MFLQLRRRNVYVTTVIFLPDACLCSSVTKHNGAEVISDFNGISISLVPIHGYTFHPNLPRLGLHKRIALRLLRCALRALRQTERASVLQQGWSLDHAASLAGWLARERGVFTFSGWGGPRAGYDIIWWKSGTLDLDSIAAAAVGK